ncbi:MAG TPA: hypothetical protein VMU67_07740 [Steroidobacteraceae bacterium]|nr:hypothetical protein [Steroidobacteraceae bacterium]
MTEDPKRARAWVHEHLAGWPVARQKLAAELVAKYGRPNQVSARELMWYENHPWKRTVLYRVGVKHNFPLPHEDVLEQTVEYRVPPAKFSDLASYNGSLVADRTRGELSAHCDSEGQNMTMLNLADDIVTGNRSVDEALGYHAQIIRALQTHVPETYPLALKFKQQTVAQAADPASEAELLEHLGD